MAICLVCAHPALLQCSGCHRVAYCSQEHQRAAWDKHKRLCKILQKIERGEPSPDPKSYCGLCGKTEGPLRTTDCCGKTVCDDYEKYVMFTFSYNSCSRNHDRYTRCHYHHNERSHGGGDWKTCSECRGGYEPELTTWYATNRFNFLDDIHPNPPTFTPKYCKKCGKVVKKIEDSGSSLPDGSVLCNACM
ncbi:hypothetical protein BDN70DRAFT_881960 [Pholiota conissans]|uniref:MYND-type domain-containing protein n=1 Tax=Pholiota conissans TaxID=109636 RepID=A0A9P5YYA7_9AGAR|nr:hypothetical protein BDN70DRAFT_881960 [Pholiota conissans]